MFDSIFKFKKIKKIFLKNKEVWHYTCENNHKWKSIQSPKGTYIYGESGQTKCPICRTPICIGNVIDKNGKTLYGAYHMEFKK